MKVEWAEAAQDDLAFFSAQAAEIDEDRAIRLLMEARRASEFLERVPYAGAAQDDGEIRKLRLGKLPFLILYVVGRDRISVTRLHHSSQNWRK